ncbi:MAG: DUF4349 domain-containing protein [Lachnospiraceae bacterium]
MRKMKKSGRIFAGAVCGMLLFGATACGAKSADMAMDSNGYWYEESKGAGTEAYFPAEVPMATEIAEDMDYILSKTEDASYGAGSNEETGGDVTLYAENTRKTIKTASLSLQTTEFDTFLTALEDHVAASGAYLQYANVYGNGYYSNRRSADYTIRVPQQNLNAFLAGIDGIATVVNKTIGEEDVTLSYVDMESRLGTLRTEQERLLELLEKAEDLDAIIRLEQRLSEVRYSIESYTARLRTYDDQITYSTVRINVSEVIRVSDPTPETIGERIRTGWSDTIYQITTGAQDFFVWFVVNIPYLVFWAVVIAAVIIIIKKKANKRKLRKSMRNNETKLDDKEQEG